MPKPDANHRVIPSQLANNITVEAHCMRLVAFFAQLVQTASR